MIKAYLSDARETYREHRLMGLDHPASVSLTINTIIEKMQLALPWAFTLYMDNRDLFDEHSQLSIPLDPLNRPHTPGTGFLMMISRAFERILEDHLERDDPMSVDILFRVTDSTIEVVEWD